MTRHAGIKALLLSKYGRKIKILHLVKVTDFLTLWDSPKIKLGLIREDTPIPRNHIKERHFHLILSRTNYVIYEED
jgi:hypothetical protein